MNEAISIRQLHLVKRYQTLGVISKFMPAAQADEYDAIKVGKFSGTLSVEWQGPRQFIFNENDYDHQPFSFTRHNGETIIPHRMHTDAGTIPKFLWTIPGFGPWEFGPAYIIHDWEFRYHSCYSDRKSFKEVNRTLLEGIKTLMESGICKKNVSAFKVIAYSVNSVAVKRHWNDLSCLKAPQVQPLNNLIIPQKNKL